MTLFTRLGLIILAVVLAGILVWGAAYAVPAAFAARTAATSAQAVLTPVSDQRVVDSPDISFIDSPSATCELPRRGTDACYITWSYLSVSAAPSNYIITMTVAIDNRPRARSQGFFQTSMYVPTEMLTFRVPCGVPGASGDPDWGLSHSYTVRARDTTGLKAANYGSVYCPADQVPLASADISGPPVGRVDLNYTFTTSAAPITSTLPVTYTWQVSGYPPLMDVNGVSRSRTFSWNSYGAKTIQVTVSNPVSTQVRTHTILIEPYQLNFPMLRK